ARHARNTRRLAAEKHSHTDTSALNQPCPLYFSAADLSLCIPLWLCMEPSVCPGIPGVLTVKTTGFSQRSGTFPDRHTSKQMCDLLSVVLMATAIARTWCAFRR